MKWLTKRPHTPTLGETRIVTKFAWLPVACDDGMTVWLDTYYITQRYLPYWAADDETKTEIEEYMRRDELCCEEFVWRPLTKKSA